MNFRCAARENGALLAQLSVTTEEIERQHSQDRRKEE